MSIKEEILDFLESTGFNSENIEIVSKGPDNHDFTNLVSKIVNELILFHKMADVAAVHGTQDAMDKEAFLLELNGFLREYGCPYESLTETTTLSERFKSEENCLLLFHYLLSELMSTQILAKNNKLKDVHVVTSSSSSLKTLSNHHRSIFTSSKPNAQLVHRFRLAADAMNFALPKSGQIPIPQTFIQFYETVQKLVENLPENYLGNPLLNPKYPLADKQWMNLEKMAEIIHKDYQHRKEMLLKRLDVTLQSFKWSSKAQKNIDAICKVIAKHEDELCQTEEIFSIAHVLSARDNPLLILHRTSSGEARQSAACKLNKLLMGTVPDRGGRAWEQEPPPPEETNYQQQHRGGGGGGRGGTGMSRGGGGGGYHQNDRGDGYSINRGGGSGSYGHGGGGFDDGGAQRRGRGRGGGGGYDNREGGGRGGRGGGYQQHQGGYHMADGSGGGGMYDGQMYGNYGHEHPANAYRGMTFESNHSARGRRY